MQEALRTLFARWGLPQRIRVDNGSPWGSWSDLPPALVLWWLGLGIEPIFNHPHCPKENALVERFNGLVDAWGEPAACPDWAAWQQRMEWVSTLQRERYPAVGGRSRLQAYPALRACPRPYDPATEAAQWDLARVQVYLEQGRFVRFVGKTGQITLYNRAYGVGRAQAGRQVFVRYEPATEAWVIQQADGKELARHPAVEITQARICGLEVCYVKPSRLHRYRQNLVAQPPT